MQCVDVKDELFKSRINVAASKHILHQATTKKQNETKLSTTNYNFETSVEVMFSWQKSLNYNVTRVICGVRSSLYFYQIDAHNIIQVYRTSANT